MELTDRKKQILRAIVDSYIRTAEPVGSKTIAQIAGLGCSSATIRNELSELTALGYLERSNEARLMHPDTVRALRFLLTKLRDEGERAAFCYIKTCLRKNVPFCGQETQSGTIVGI